MSRFGRLARSLLFLPVAPASLGTVLGTSSGFSCCWLLTLLVAAQYTLFLLLRCTQDRVKGVPSVFRELIGLDYAVAPSHRFPMDFWIDSSGRY
jgi:hypothetical protein